MIVVANEKGGSGKSTVAIHVAVALLRAGESVATIDLDSRQRSFTHYVDNRLAWARQRGLDLPAPTHVCFDEDAEFADDEAAGREVFVKTVAGLTESHGVIVVDTPCQNNYLTRLAHTLADTLITPLNDSFVDLDVLSSVDPETFAVAGTSYYARLVDEARRERRAAERRTSTGTCCATGCPARRRATSGSSATHCRICRNGSGSGSSKDSPSV